ncbi:hypothetical protein V8E36_004861 [Tilletia maclaganii]
MQQPQLQVTPAMIFGDRTVSQPNALALASKKSVAADDCLSVILSSPALSAFDELSPYPAPPSTASTEASYTACTVSPDQLAISAAASSIVPANLSVNIPAPSSDAILFGFAGHHPYTMPPLSASTDASFASFSTSSPGMPLYSPHPVGPSGCLYEAAMSQGTAAPQQQQNAPAFPAQFNFRASYPGMPPQHFQAAPTPAMPSANTFYNNGEPHIPSVLTTPVVKSEPAASFVFSTPSASSSSSMTGPASSMGSATSCPPRISAISSFVGSAPYAPPLQNAPHPGLSTSGNGPHYVPQQSQPCQPGSDGGPQIQFASMFSSLPQLSRSKESSADEPAGLNLYDASGIRDSGILFAPNGRILLACSFCKLRKLRCNGGAPGCSQCIKRGLCCSYPTTIRRRGKAKTKGKKLKSASSIAGESGCDSSSNAGSSLDDQAADEFHEFIYSIKQSASRFASEEPEAERSRKRKCTAFEQESDMAPSLKKRSQSCHGTAVA